MGAAASGLAQVVTRRGPSNDPSRVSAELLHPSCTVNRSALSTRHDCGLCNINPLRVTFM
jgi:hypothetical protein